MSEHCEECGEDLSPEDKTLTCKQCGVVIHLDCADGFAGMCSECYTDFCIENGFEILQSDSP